MPKFARAHHFVPQFLLAGFTEDGTKSGRLWTFDRLTGKTRSSTPKRVAFRNDFYRVDLPEVEPDYVETLLSDIEGVAANAIRNVLRTASMPSEREEYLRLVCFIALMAARVPSARRTVDQVAWMIHRQIFDRVLQTRETWAAAVEEARAEGINLGNVSYDQMRDFFDRAEYTVRTDQNWQINMMLHTMGFIAPSMIRRNWVLLISESGSFICADHPVALYFVRPKSAMDVPGFGREDTEVTFPLSQNIVMLGLWGPRRSAARRLNRKTIAHYNRIAIRHSERFLFSPKNEFCWLDVAGNVCYDFPPLVGAT